jgi:hypothetical protein
MSQVPDVCTDGGEAIAGPSNARATPGLPQHQDSMEEGCCQHCHVDRTGHGVFLGWWALHSPLMYFSEEGIVL